MMPSIAIAQAGTPADQVSDGAETAQDALGSIVVTARRREENLQTVPVATSVVDTATISAAGTFAPIQLSQAATGLIVTPFSGDRSNIILTIRGQAYVTGTLFPAVVPYFAEVPMIKLTTGTFFDLENVQVLRGPQGTLFGRVTDGGNVMIQPHRPTNELEGYGEVKVGNYDLRAFEGALNIPLIEDKLMVRGAFEINRRDGFSRSLLTGARFDNISYESARFSVLAKPTENLENYTVISFNHANEQGGSAVIAEINRPAVIASVTPSLGAAGAAALANRLEAELAAQRARSPYINNANEATFDKRRQLFIVNNTSWDVSDNLTVKAILGYMRYKQHVQFDSDGTSLGYAAQLGILPTPLNNQRQMSGELQLQGNGFDKKLKWTLGTYWDRQTTPSPSETLTTSFGLFARSSIQSIRTTSKAIFGQASYEIVDGLTAEGGIRYTEDTSRSRTAVVTAIMDGTDPIPHGQCFTTIPADVLPPPSSAPCRTTSADFNQTTYLASLQWQATDDLFFYAKYSKGYRPGGFDSSGVTAGYGPERLYSKEIGAKTEFNIASIPVRLNVAGFWDEFKDLQRLTFVLGPNGGNGTAVTNAAAATIKGIEVEGTVLPTSNLRLGVNYSYLDAEYDRSAYTDAQLARACPANPLTTVPDLTIFCPLGAYARTPKHMFTLSARYTVPMDPSMGSLGIGGSWYHTAGAWSVSTSYVNPGSFIPAYDIVNADITWKSVAGSNVDLSLFGTNILDKQYQVSESSATFMGGSGIGFGTYGEPQMYGVRARYNF
jgi:iron complex outermembrane receptor protein